MHTLSTRRRAHAIFTNMCCPLGGARLRFSQTGAFRLLFSNPVVKHNCQQGLLPSNESLFALVVWWLGLNIWFRHNYPATTVKVPVFVFGACSPASLKPSCLSNLQAAPPHGRYHVSCTVGVLSKDKPQSFQRSGVLSILHATRMSSSGNTGPIFE